MTINLMMILIVFVVQQIEGKRTIIHDTKSDDQINFPWTPAWGEENVYRNKLKSLHWCLDIRKKISLSLIEIEK